MGLAIIQDCATVLTLNYLSAVESRLCITWAAPNQPICLPDQFDDGALKSLKTDLDDMLKGNLADRARNATQKYGKDHIQTVGFGLAPDFDQFIKLGFLYGDRVVLWDFLSNRLLLENSGISNLDLANTACKLLMLKPAVERGAVVILPHPMEWSNLAEMVAEDLQEQRVRSGAVFGISMALSAVEEGLPLHPFTLLGNEAQPKASPAVSGNVAELYSKENYIFQRSLSDLLKNQQFTYLQSVSAAEFQKVVSQHEGLHQKLRKLFNLSAGLSTQQISAELRTLQKELPNLIKKQNDAVFKYGAEGTESSVELVTSQLTLLNASTMGKVTFADLGLRLAIALRKWISVPEKNIVVQAFQTLKQKEGQEFLTELHEAEARPGLAVSIQNDLGNHQPIAIASDPAFKEALAAFWATEGGTEQRHHYLLSLPVHLATKIVRSLGALQRQILVNQRRFQEAYIAEYLGELWDVDRTAFWKHIETMFKSREGLIISDYEPHIEIMCREDMPRYVWLRLLKCLLATDLRGGTGKANFFGEFYADILVFQTTKAPERKQRQFEFQRWFQSLKHTDRDLLLNFLRKTFNNKVPAWVRRKPATQPVKAIPSPPARG
jgi:hypothetical protein